MIAVRLQGRLGNQLFQYAFIYVAAKQLNTSFYIDQHIERSVVNKYFEKLNPPKNHLCVRLFGINGFKNIFSYHLRRFYYKKLAQFYKLQVKQYDFNEDQHQVTIQNDTLYLGYFQSELLIRSIENTIREKFILKNEFVDQFNKKYGNLYRNNKIVTIHIRRTDYLNLPHLNLGGADLSLPVDYYQKAIAKYEGKNVHFIFISDDIEFVENNFRQLTNKTISTDTEIMDFQHLLNADGCIISNSTFSWWGAWLNSTKNKTIYCPRYYLGYRDKKEFPQNIYPHEWKQIDF